MSRYGEAVEVRPILPTAALSTANRRPFPPTAALSTANRRPILPQLPPEDLVYNLMSRYGEDIEVLNPLLLLYYSRA